MQDVNDLIKNTNFEGKLTNISDRVTSDKKVGFK